MVEEPKQFIVPTDVLNQIKNDLLDEVKPRANAVFHFEDKALGKTIELQSPNLDTPELKRIALESWKEFNGSEKGGRSYIG